MNFIKNGIGPFLGGLLFAIGLGFSGMTEPVRVIGFLDVFGQWDPSLAFVMIGAIAVNASLFRWIRTQSTPLFAVQFYLPTKLELDKRLLLGSAIFGIGWGIVGLCPGPGIVASTTGGKNILIFMSTLLMGSLVAKHLVNRLDQKAGQ